MGKWRLFQITLASEWKWHTLIFLMWQKNVLVFCRLKPLDIEFMKKLHSKVNIVPVIAKADCLTKKEILRLKSRILSEIETNGIKIYPLPDCDSDEDEDYKEQVRQLKEAVPFAVCGATSLLEVKGRKVRGRQYPWGVVEVENPDHCDFIKLRTMLM